MFTFWSGQHSFFLIDKEASAEHHAAVALAIVCQFEGSSFQFLFRCRTQTILFLINPGSPLGLYSICAGILVVRPRLVLDGLHLINIFTTATKVPENAVVPPPETQLILGPGRALVKEFLPVFKVWLTPNLTGACDKMLT